MFFAAQLATADQLRSVHTCKLRSNTNLENDSTYELATKADLFNTI
jgi:hypothetical protein